MSKAVCFPKIPEEGRPNTYIKTVARLGGFKVCFFRDDHFCFFVEPPLAEMIQFDFFTFFNGIGSTTN